MATPANLIVRQLLAAELSELGERHGFDIWRLVGSGRQAAVDGLAAARRRRRRPEHACGTHRCLHHAPRHLARFRGEDIQHPLDGVIARLLMAAGQPEQARRQLDNGLQLAHDTGMHYYDAELLRLRAQTHHDPAARRADLEAALELARHQGAHLFELRAALDDFELRGELRVLPWRMRSAALPDDSTIPEVARARAAI